jgi:hypothetical protein
MIRKELCNFRNRSGSVWQSTYQNTCLWTGLTCCMVTYTHVLSEINTCIHQHPNFKFEIQLQPHTGKHKESQREGVVARHVARPSFHMFCPNSPIHSHRATQPWTQGLYGSDKCMTICRFVSAGYEWTALYIQIQKPKLLATICSPFTDHVETLCIASPDCSCLDYHV